MSADTTGQSTGQSTSKTSRRSFFTRGGAALGAGLATTVAGGALAAGSPAAPQDPDSAAEREVLRQLQLTFASHMEGERYGEAADLFARGATLTLSGETATGGGAIRGLLSRYQRQDVPILHGTYRQSAAQQQRDTVALASAERATATFHIDVELCRPLQADCTAARMAQLQGGFAERRWEAGKMDVAFVKTAGRWRIASLNYQPS